jgi:hypothetical protein
MKEVTKKKLLSSSPPQVLLSVSLLKLSKKWPQRRSRVQEGKPQTGTEGKLREASRLLVVLWLEPTAIQEEKPLLLLDPQRRLEGKLREASRLLVVLWLDLDVREPFRTSAIPTTTTTASSPRDVPLTDLEMTQDAQSLLDPQTGLEGRLREVTRLLLDPQTGLEGRLREASRLLLDPQTGTEGRLREASRLLLDPQTGLEGKLREVTRLLLVLWLEPTAIQEEKPLLLLDRLTRTEGRLREASLLLLDPQRRLEGRLRGASRLLLVLWLDLTAIQEEKPRLLLDPQTGLEGRLREASRLLLGQLPSAIDLQPPIPTRSLVASLFDTSPPTTSKSPRSTTREKPLDLSLVTKTTDQTGTTKPLIDSSTPIPIPPLATTTTETALTTRGLVTSTIALLLRGTTTGTILGTEILSLTLVALATKVPDRLLLISQGERLVADRKSTMTFPGTDTTALALLLIHRTILLPVDTALITRRKSTTPPPPSRVLRSSPWRDSSRKKRGASWPRNPRERKKRLASWSSATRCRRNKTPWASKRPLALPLSSTTDRLSLSLFFSSLLFVL